MDQLLSHWLKIRLEERRQTALLFLFLFFATSFVIIGRTARDALLLSRSGVWQLPLMYVGIAVASSLVVLAHSHLLTRWNPFRVLRVSLFVVCACLLALRILIGLAWPGAYPTLYIFHEVAGSIIVVQFWTFANEAFTTREAKRLFGVIGSGGVMAGSICGFGGAWLAPRLGTSNLLLVCILSLLICAMILTAVRGIHEVAVVAAGQPHGPPPGRGPVGNRSYARALGGLATVLTICVSIVDFEFKVSARAHFSEDELATFFGALYGGCGLLSFVMHLLLTSRLLTRRGILPALLALPSVLTIGALGLVVQPALPAAIYARAVDLTLRYSLNETCMQLLYLPLPVRGRRRLKAIVEGGLKPLAIGTTGILLMLVGHQTSALRGLAGILLMGLAIWIGLALQLRKGYVAALLASLTRRGALEDEIDVSLSDVASTQALIEALHSGDEGLVLGALELLPARRGHDWSGQILPLLQGRGRAVRLAAIDFCRREGIEILASVVDSWLEDPDEEIRAAAVQFLNGSVAVEPFLTDAAPVVRAQAVVGLIRNPHEGVSARGALEELERLRVHPDPSARRWAAWAMGELGGPEAGLRLMLDDSAPEVVREAIEAAGKAQLLGVVATLVSRLKDTQCGEDAAGALGQYGEVVLAPLLQLFPLPEEDEFFRTNVFAALRGIGTRRVAEELLRHLPDNRVLRYEVLQVTFQLMRSRREGPLRMDQIRSTLMLETRDCYQWSAVVFALGQGEHWELLSEAVQEELLQARERAFLLLAHVYPVRPIQTLNQALQSERAGLVSNALEVVDELLDPEVRTLLLPLLEAAPLNERVRRGRALFSLTERSALDWCRHFLQSEDRWLKLCSLNTIRGLVARTLIRDVQALLATPDPVIRETALVALSPLLSEEEHAQLWETYLEDEVPLIRRLARHARGGMEGLMISSVDKVLFLKRVALFSQLPGRELLHLASIAEQVSFPEQSVILSEGSEGDSLYLILSGKVGVTRGGRQIAVLGPRECFGEMAILDREPRSATVTALDDVTALRIERDSFYDLLAQKREIALQIIRILVQRLRGANER